MQSQPAENASSQPAQPAAQSQPGDQAPAAQAPVVAEPESYTLYDRGSGETFTVDARQLARGMLAAEMPPTFHPEALKAQAVAGHTYVSYLRRLREAPGRRAPTWNAMPPTGRATPPRRRFNQRYGELADAYWQAICQAADQVSAYLLTYQGQPILAAYCSMSNGQTEDAANVWSAGLPYLTPVESFGDTLAPDYETQVTFTPQELSQAVAAAWPQLTLEGDPAGWLEVAARSPSGYVTQVRLGEGLTVHGKELRAALGLRSADFDLGWMGRYSPLPSGDMAMGWGFPNTGRTIWPARGPPSTRSWPTTTRAAPWPWLPPREKAPFANAAGCARIEENERGDPRKSAERRSVKQQWNLQREWSCLVTASFRCF